MKMIHSKRYIWNLLFAFSFLLNSGTLSISSLRFQVQDPDKKSLDYIDASILSSVGSPPYLVKDVHSGTGFSWPYYFTEFNGEMYFEAYDEIHGTELWKSDGTEAGTVLVKDIAPGALGANPNALIQFNGKLIFRADDGVNGGELWESDGTEDGTKIIKNINSGGSSDPYGFTEANGILFFMAQDDLSGMELWKTDGTADGTLLVKDIYSGSGNGIVFDDYQWMTSLNGTLYFTATDGTNGFELWKSDGTEGGTAMVKNIHESGDSNPSFLTVANNTLFFSADDGIHGLELWKSDGTNGGTTLVKEINASSLSKFKKVDNTLFFMGGDNTWYSTELWISDGTEGGTTKIKDFINYSNPVGQCLSSFNGSLFFSGINNYVGLWKSDGTTDGTVLVKSDFDDNDYISQPCSFLQVNADLFFMADDGIHGRELWKTDGTSSGTSLVKNIHPVWDSIPSISASMNGMLYFAADDGFHGRELWISDGTESGTQLLKDINNTNADGIQELSFEFGGPPIVAVGNSLFFQADDGAHGRSVWKTDGTPANTLIAFYGRDREPENLTNVNGTLFFNTYNSQLWTSLDLPGRNATSSQVWTFPDSCVDGPCLSTLTASGNNLYFTAFGDWAYGVEPWMSNGVITTMVEDINPGHPSSFPSSFKDIKGNLYFGATTDAYGDEPYMRDSLTGAVTMIKDINPTGSSYPEGFILAGDLVYFTADDGNGYELWKTDGTDLGTSMVKDIDVSGNSYASALATIGNVLFFVATDGSHGHELWRTDGTQDGTYIVKDINPSTTCNEWGNPGGSGPCNSYVSGAAVLNGWLYFFADDGVNGLQLWKTDGTESGTNMINPIHTSIGPSWGMALTVLNGMVYFTADDGIHGTELWRTDGTAEGTVMVFDIASSNLCDSYGTSPGTSTNPCGSFPMDFTAMNGFLFFSADDTIHGRELWAYDARSQKTFTSQAAADGWVLESSESSGKGETKNNKSTTFYLGDDVANKQYRSILSFNTSGIPANATITRVTLKLKKSDVAGGGNPIKILRGFLVDIKTGNFGKASLASDDFQAKPSKAYGPFKPTLSGGWYSIDLTSGQGYINRSGNTQIRLRFKLDDNDNSVANYLKLYGGNAGAVSSPQLIVEYYIP